MINAPRGRWLLGLLVALVFAAAAAIVVRAMKRRRLSEAEHELAYHIEAECSSLASDLRLRRADLAKGLEYLSHPELTPEQRQGVERAKFTSPLTGDMTQSARQVAG